MSEHQSPPVAPPRSRPALMLVPPSPPPCPPSGERLLVVAEGFLLTSERLEVGGRTWRLEELRGFSTRQEAPGWKLPLGALLVAAGLAPTLLPRADAWDVTAALVGVTVLLFASILRLVLAADTYCLVVWTAEGARQVLRSEDHQLFARVEEALGEVLGRVEPRPVAPPRRLVLVR
jgi:hypothetical protein